MLQLIIIGAYFSGMIAIGAVSRKKLAGTDDFFVAGRKGSSLFITGSLLATIVGGSATVGMAGLEPRGRLPILRREHVPSGPIRKSP